MLQRFKRPILWTVLLTLMTTLLVIVMYQTFKSEPQPQLPSSNIWQPASLKDQYWVDEGKNQVDIVNITRIQDHLKLNDMQFPLNNEMAIISIKLKFGQLHTTIGELNFHSDLFNSILATTNNSNESLQDFIKLNTLNFKIDQSELFTTIESEVPYDKLENFINHTFNAFSSASFDSIYSIDDSNNLNQQLYIDAITAFYQQNFHPDNIQITVSSPFSPQSIIEQVQFASKSLPSNFKPLTTINTNNIYAQLPILHLIESKDTQHIKLAFKVNLQSEDTYYYLDFLKNSMFADMPLSIKNKISEIVSFTDLTPVLQHINEQDVLFGIQINHDKNDSINLESILNIFMSYFNTLEKNDFAQAMQQLQTHQSITQNHFNLDSSIVSKISMIETNDLQSILKKVVLIPDYNDSEFLSLKSQFKADNLFIEKTSIKPIKQSTNRLNSKILSKLRVVSDQSYHFSINPFELDNIDNSDIEETNTQASSILYSPKPNKIYEQPFTTNSIQTELWGFSSHINNSIEYSNLKLKIWPDPSNNNFQAFAILYSEYLEKQLEDLSWMATQRDIMSSIEYSGVDNAFIIEIEGPSKHIQKVWFTLLSQFHNLNSSLSTLNSAKNSAIKKINQSNNSKSFINDILFNSLNHTQLVNSIESISINQLLDFEEKLNFHSSVMYINNQSSTPEKIKLLEYSLEKFKISNENKSYINTQIQKNSPLNNNHLIYKTQSPIQYSSIFNRTQLNELKFRAHAITLLFNDLMAEPLTKLIIQKDLTSLSDDISINALYQHNHGFIDIYLPSDSLDPALLHLHLEQILSEEVSFLDNMTDTFFDNRKSLISKKLRLANNSVPQESSIHWKHIQSNHFHFNDDIRVAHELDTLSKESFVRIIKTQLLANNAKKISIFDLGENTELNKTYSTNKQFLEDTQTISDINFFRKK